MGVAAREDSNLRNEGNEMNVDEDRGARLQLRRLQETAPRSNPGATFTVVVGTGAFGGRIREDSQAPVVGRIQYGRLTWDQLREQRYHRKELEGVASIDEAVGLD